jgi:hypothetical protein
MTEYKALHAKEKEKLENTGYNMKLNFNALMQSVNIIDGKDDNFRCVIWFKDAHKKMLVIYNELCGDKKKYIYDIDRYTECKKELDDAITILMNEYSAFKRESLYNQILKQAQQCQVAEIAYSDAWSDIRTFDRKNKNPNIQRSAGYHAFLKKSSMGDILHELKMLSSCK